MCKLQRLMFHVEHDAPDAAFNGMKMEIFNSPQFKCKLSGNSRRRWQLFEFGVICQKNYSFYGDSTFRGLRFLQILPEFRLPRLMFHVARYAANPTFDRMKMEIINFPNLGCKRSGNWRRRWNELDFGANCQKLLNFRDPSFRSLCFLRT